RCANRSRDAARAPPLRNARRCRSRRLRARRRVAVTRDGAAAGAGRSRSVGSRGARRDGATRRQPRMTTTESVLMEDGAESIDAAREQWWTGLRSAEEAAYNAEGFDFDADEAEFRRGFEVAQLPSVRGKSYAEAINYLAQRYPDAFRRETFRR